jgi:TRAP-type C4-dicarboxylate transport system substrate-binding protein
MFTLRRMGLFILVLTGMMMICAGATLGAPIVFSLGHVDSQPSHNGVGVDAFVKEVERLSGGSMQINAFHAGKLGPVPVEITNTLNGSQDMHLIVSEFMTTFIEESKVLSLPYLFESLEHLQKFKKSNLWKPAVDRIDSLGAVILDKEWTWKVYDPRGLISVRPISTPKDLEGVKIRLWESKTAIETWKGFGANTIVVPRPEFYLAFKQGVVEGGPETIGVAVDQKSVEVGKFWTRTDEYNQINNIMVNKKKYESLTSEQKGILQKAVENAGNVFVETTKRNYSEKKKRAAEEYGVKIIEPPLGPWRERGAATIARLIKEGYVSEDFINKIRALK